MEFQMNQTILTVTAEQLAALDATRATATVAGILWAGGTSFCSRNIQGGLPFAAFAKGRPLFALSFSIDATRVFSAKPPLNRHFDERRVPRVHFRSRRGQAGT